MSSHSTISNNRYVSISDITIRFDKSHKSVQSVHLSIGEKRREVQWEHNGHQSLQATFTPSLDLPLSCQFTLHPRHRHQLGPISLSKKGQDIVVNAQELLQARSYREDRREWRRLCGETEVVIGLSFGTVIEGETVEARGQDIVKPNFGRQDNVSLGRDTDLLPTTDEIIRTCPRFRILVVGKSGVGKSSLINHAFGATQASVSDIDPGKADINTEIPSADNKPFVLHDSQGFEHGEVGNVKIVQRFIEERNGMPHIKDKLHAVWLCFEIPRAGGRIFETGVEDFLKLKTAGKLGRMPVIAVFTKYDQLISRVKRTMDRSLRVGRDDENILEVAKKEADNTLQSICICPLEELVGTEVPHATVSTKKGYENTLSDLIRLTFDNVHKHVAKEASIVSAMAQKVNHEIKIKGSIEVGRTRYWKSLASSANFPGKTMKSCLEVIHTDIVVTWGFNDKNMHLHSEQFKALMSNMVGDLADRDAPNPNKGLTVGLSMVGTIAGIVSALAGPAAPIVIPIAASLVLAKWVYDVYQQSHGTLRRLMAYIVDLTLILQNLFWLVTDDDLLVSRRLVKLAFKAYDQSDTSKQVHFEIAQHVREANVFVRANRDSTLDKIIELIDRYRIEPAEMLKLKGQIGIVAGEDDEPWDVPASDESKDP